MTKDSKEKLLVGLILTAVWFIAGVAVVLIGNAIQEAQAQTTMSASVQPNICNSNIDILKECCE